MQINNSKVKLMGPSLDPWSPTKPPSRQIAILMSGGVDSSVTAHLLKEAGWDVLGITMKVPISCDAGSRSCCGADAAFVCSELGISHYFIDVTENFGQLIIEPFRRAYANGRTPNPCADCNALLKFSLIWDFVSRHFGVEYLATGHYARILKHSDGTRLAQAIDKEKDQSYFLYGIRREKLEKLMFPIGDRTKQEIRAIAEDIQLCVAEKSESMELCFAAQGDYRGALADGQTDVCGEITDMHGNVIGTHKGISNYTIGQRRGLGYAAGKPVYVGNIDPANNTVALGTKEQVSFFTITADQVNILIPELYKSGQQLFGKIRSGGIARPCRIIKTDKNLTVTFEESQFAPCPGQKLVLYENNECVVAGGEILSASNPVE